MSYKQNNPFSRKSSPLNKDDKWIQKATESIKERGTEGVCTGDKFGGPTCPPGSKRYNLAKTFKKIAKDRKGGPSRESSSLGYDDRLDESLAKDGKESSKKQSMKDRRDESKGMEKSKGKGAYSSDPGMSRRSSESDWLKYGGDVIDETAQNSPLNNTGMTGLNYSKELRYNAVDDITQGKGEADYGFSRESSSPLDYGSWAHEDATRAKDLYKKGDYAHARALGIDEHDADYAKHWHKDEAEHGPSRKSRSERLRSRAMKRSERSGAEWGDYDYEDARVQKMLSKASELDERSGRPKVKPMKMKLEKNIKPLPKNRVLMQQHKKTKRG